MTTVLALDTTSKHASISVSSGEEILTEYNFVTRGDMSALLIPAIDHVLNRSSLTLDKIDIIGVGIGPGLFTGIRVGLATIKGLLTARPKPVVPVTTLEALAIKEAEAGCTIVPVIDARRSEIYTAAYSFDNGQAKEIVPPQLIRIDEMTSLLEHSGDFRLIGSGAYVHREYLEQQFESPRIISRSNFLAVEISRLAFQRFQEGTYLTDLSDLMPLYIRKSDAEQNLLKAANNQSRNPQPVS